MELYSLKMPPFLRIQWRSKEVKEKYEPMFHEAQNVFRLLEKETVAQGIRRVTTDHVAPEHFDVAQQHYIQRGLYFLPLKQVANYAGFATYHPQVEEGKPWRYYGVIAKTVADAEAFAHADEIGDHIAMGRLLGYPQCCLEAFQNVWLEGYTDPIWQQAQASSQSFIREQEGNRIRLKDVPWQSQSLLRLFGIGPIFHVKCSTHCQHTLDIANQWIDLADQQKMKGLAEMELFQRMPMKWDCYKGISYITSPLFKISTNSMATTQPYQVEFEGTYFPSEGGNGLGFPWSEEIVTMSRNGNTLNYSKE